MNLRSMSISVPEIGRIRTVVPSRSFSFHSAAGTAPAAAGRFDVFGVLAIMVNTSQSVGRETQRRFPHRSPPVVAGGSGTPHRLEQCPASRAGVLIAIKSALAAATAAAFLIEV